MKNVLDRFPPAALPPLDDKYVRGSNNSQIPDVIGQQQAEATSQLVAAGFQVSVSTQPGAAKGTVLNVSPNGSAIPGSVITIYVSDGSQIPAPAAPTAPAPGIPGFPGIQIPALPPIPIPIPIPR